MAVYTYYQIVDMHLEIYRRLLTCGLIHSEINIIEPRHVISNNVAFYMNTLRRVLSLKTPNAVHSVA